MDRYTAAPSVDKVLFAEDGAAFSAAVFSSFAGTYCCRLDDVFSLVDHGTGLGAFLGYSAEELDDRFHGCLPELIFQEDRQEFLQKVKDQLVASDEVELACRMLRKDGTVIWALVKGRRMDVQNHGVCLCGIITDISRSKGIHDELSRRLDQQNIILAQTENIIFEWDLLSDTIFFSDTWERIFGYQPITHDLGKSVSDLASHLHPDDVPLLAQHISLLESGISYQATDARVARADGKYLWCRFRATAIRNREGKICKLVGIIINIDDEKRQTSALKHQAERDSLTKLLNKQTAHEKVVQYLNGASESANCVLMIIDVDNFKHVNDQYGHMVGDSVLTKCAREIKRLFRPTDVVARIGGDEFLVLMKDTADRELVRNRCSQLISAFRSILRPYLQADTLSCSIGASFAPEHGTSYYDLFIAADRALYHAKGLGKNQFTFYDSHIAALPVHQFASAVNAQIDSDEYPEPVTD